MNVVSLTLVFKILRQREYLTVINLSPKSDKHDICTFTLQLA